MMKQVQLTIQVSDQKYDRLIEFLTQNFSDVAIKTDDDYHIPEEHKQIVQQRIKNSNPADFISIEELDKKIKL